MFYGRDRMTEIANSTTELTDISRIFQSRKKRATRWGAATFLIGLGILLASAKGMIRIPNSIGVLVAGIGCVVAASYLSCPACKEVPRAPRLSFWDEGGILTNPERCPSCGVRLK